LTPNYTVSNFAVFPHISAYRGVRVGKVMGKDKLCVSNGIESYIAYRNPMISKNVGSTRSESGAAKNF
jgi:hypothetical protein